MTKRITRGFKDDIRVSDSVVPTVTRRIIIPLNFTNSKLEVNYFIPRFKEVPKGDNVVWENLDISEHQLKFYDASGNNFVSLFDSEIIKPNTTSKPIKFDHDLHERDQVTYKISWRFSKLLAENPDRHRKLYDEMKNLYSTRSKLVHGNKDKVEDEEVELAEKHMRESLKGYLREMNNNSFPTKLKFLEYLDFVKN